MNAELESKAANERRAEEKKASDLEHMLEQERLRIKNEATKQIEPSEFWEMKRRNAQSLRDKNQKSFSL